MATIVDVGRQVFADQSVENNLLRARQRVGNRARIGEMLEREFERLPRRNERRVQLAGTLCGGEQQMLASRGL